MINTGVGTPLFQPLEFSHMYEQSTVIHKHDHHGRNSRHVGSTPYLVAGGLSLGKGLYVALKHRGLVLQESEGSHHWLSLCTIYLHLGGESVRVMGSSFVSGQLVGRLGGPSERTRAFVLSSAYTERRPREALGASKCSTPGW